MAGLSYRADKLRYFVDTAARKLGVPGEDAEVLADHLVDAELRGHQSHGVSRLIMYSDRMRRGTMTPVTRLETIVDSGSVVVLDGHDGVGQVIALRSMELAIERARKLGVVVVAVRFSNHFGTAAYYSRRAAQEKCVGITITNASSAMAPWGGREAAVGNNPWAIGVPAGSRGEVVLDMANTVVARGKIRVAAREGKQIPLGWAIDADGKPTTDPAAALAGIILPIGGHKGYGISMMMDVLAGVLTGSAFGTQVSGSFENDRRSGVGHLFVVLDITRFMPVAEFEDRMESLIAELKAVPTAEGFDEIFFPGEPEQRALHRSHDIIRLPDQTVSELTALGVELGVDFPEPE